MKTMAHLCHANDNFQQWADHVIITARTEALPEGFLADFFKPKDGEYAFAQRGVAPFTGKEVTQYLGLYVQGKAAQWKDAVMYQQKLDDTPGLAQFTRTPFTLNMILGILPGLVADGRGFTRARLYELYMHESFDKENARLLHIGICSHV